MRACVPACLHTGLSRYIRTMSVLNWAIRGDEDDAVSERFVQLMDSLHVDTWYENFFRDPYW